MIKTIGVIGAGQMGNGIAHVCALAGYDVVLQDINAEQLGKALETIQGNMHRQVARGKISEADSAAALTRIRTSNSINAFKETDFEVEAATANEAVKKKIFAELCPVQIGRASCRERVSKYVEMEGGAVS